MRSTRPAARKLAVASLALVLSATIAGCTASPTSPDAGADADGPVVVWVDAARLDQAQAYANEKGAEQYDIVVIDDLSTKLAQVQDDPGQRPDVVFATAGAAGFQERFGNLYDLSGVIPADVQSDFGGALSACQVGDLLICLPGDVSTTMLWYNAPLMEEFGYELPTTWEEYAEIGDAVAQDHPGYVIGSCVDWACPNLFFRANSCDGVDSNSGTEAVVFLADDPRCQEVADLLDPLIQNKSVATLGLFDQDFATLVAEQKVLMLPGWVWFPGALFTTAPAGSIGAATLPVWEDGETQQAAGAGAQWIVLDSSTRKNAAVEFVVAQTTDVDLLSSILTFPAYLPAQEPWAKVQAENAMFATDPTNTFVSAGEDLATVDLTIPPGPDLLTSFSNAVGPALKAGGTITASFGDWQAALVQSGTDLGLSITEK